MSRGTNTIGGCWGKACSDYHLYKNGSAWSGPHTARLDSSIKMLVPLVLLLTSVLLDVEAEVSQGPCNDPGTTTTEESWSCSNGDSKCTKTVNVCNSNGFGFREAGYDNYLANGLSNSVGGGGWDCRQISFFRSVLIFLIPDFISSLAGTSAVPAAILAVEANQG